MPDDPNCVFCAILAGRAPASVVHQDDRCTAFLDIRPLVRGHLLVVPNRHAPGLADLQDGGHLFEVARRLAGALRAAEGVRCDGVNLLLADGDVAGQEVPHVHLHVLPRYEGDGFRWSHGPLDPPTRDELDRSAAGIRAHLAEAVPGWLGTYWEQGFEGYALLVFQPASATRPDGGWALDGMHELTAGDHLTVWNPDGSIALDGELRMRRRGLFGRRRLHGPDGIGPDDLIELCRHQPPLRASLVRAR